MEEDLHHQEQGQPEGHSPHLVQRAELVALLLPGQATQPAEAQAEHSHAHTPRRVVPQPAQVIYYGNRKWDGNWGIQIYRGKNIN